ncbi:MAG: sigma-70 family RNA polymerase sigma factor [Bacilli bacterium]|nr:sigma-70 family RNA polymerase sigma factor [Bacilli bacterium]
MMLFEKNLELVEKIVNRMNYGFISKEDLKQAGLMGLFNAAQKYNPNLGVKFNTYATYYIIGEIKKELRDNQLIKLNRELYRIIREIKKNEHFSSEEIAKRLNVTRENVILAYNYLYDIVSLNQSRSKNEDKERELLEEIPAQLRRTQIDEAVDCLQGIDQEIIILRYFKNYTQTEIAKMKNESQSKISRIESRALEKIRSYLLGKGI